jgi:hypothetical protein
MAVSNQRNILIIDDQKDYVEPISQVLAELPNLRDFSLTFEHQANGSVAFDRTCELLKEGILPILSIDLHMGGTKLNGDTLIFRLAEEGIDLPFVVVTGTIAEKRLRKIVTTLGIALPIFNKADFDPIAISNGKGMGDPRLENRLADALDNFSTGKFSTDALDLLREVASQDYEIPDIYLLVDWVKSKSMKIEQDYGNILRMQNMALPNTEGFYSGNEQDIAERIHAFKNDIGLIVSRLGRGNYISFSTQLIYDLTDFQHELIDKIKGSSPQSKPASVNDIVETLIKKYNTDNYVQIISDIKENGITVNCDPNQLEAIINELICNAIKYNDETVCARVEWSQNELRIINYIHENSTLLTTFSIENNEILGEMPTVSKHKTGTAKGLQHVLHLAKEVLGISLSFEVDYEMAIARLNFKDKLKSNFNSIKKDRANTSTLENRNNIIFICHNNRPEITFSTAINLIPEGFSYNFLNPSNLFLSNEDLSNDPKLQNEFNQFIDQNFEILNRSCLCVVHMNEIDFPALNYIQVKHPHLQFLPVNQYGKSYYKWNEDRIPCVYEPLPEGRFTESKLKKYLLDSDQISLADLMTGMFLKKPKPEVFRAIINIARRVVEDQGL